MRQEMRAEREIVRAIWNQDLTLKICSAEDFIPDPTRECVCGPGGFDEVDLVDADEERRDLGTRPNYCGAIVVSVDGAVMATLCACASKIDREFVEAYKDADFDVRAFAKAIGKSPFSIDDWMEQLAAHFPPDLGAFTERGSRTVVR